MPTSGGTRPFCACGTWFITHKVAALGRLIDRYGAYLARLTTMAEDSSIKAVDRQKLEGYVGKWRNAKYLLGSAFCSMTCLTLSLLSAYIYNYAKIKTEVFFEYDSSLLGELYGKFSSILVHGK